MILTFNKETGKMETVAGAGILPTIPMIVPDFTNPLASISEQTDTSFFPANGITIPHEGSFQGTPYIAPADCFILGSIQCGNPLVQYNFSVDNNTFRLAMFSTITEAIVGNPYFVSKGSKITFGIHNTTGAAITYNKQFGFLNVFGVKLTTVTPNVIDVGTHPGYSLAEMPVMKTLSDGTQEQLQTIDGLKIWQKSYELNATIGTTITPVTLETGFFKRFLGIVTEYSYLRLTNGAVMCIPIHNDGDTVVEMWVRNDNTLCWGAKQGSSGLTSGILTIRYAYNP